MKHLFAFAIVFTMLFGAVTANGSVLMNEGFEGALDDWYHIDGDFWHREDYRAASGDYSMAYNQGDYGFYDYWTGDSANYGILMSAAIDVSNSAWVDFNFDTWLSTENDGNQGQGWYDYDIAHVQIYDAAFNWYYTFTPDINDFTPQTWQTLYGFDIKPMLDGFGLSEFRFGFYFDTVDGIDNMYEGWYVDNLYVYDDQTAPPVPEPSTWLLLSTGLLGVVPIARRKFRR